MTHQERGRIGGAIRAVQMQTEVEQGRAVQRELCRIEREYRAYLSRLKATEALRRNTESRRNQRP